MNEERLLPTLKNKARFTFWETTALLTWILVKLTLLASMINKGAVEFIYAGF
ncbi:MAG: hypothetical protein QF502_07740 [Nitrospinaceae bacterium]|jgi:hypothetical protein|nr:hypothetical protein [Nitrospinaceae bacterium]|tara:strand:- start:256 stop:411 length:156 start_codon:yes stop_codon:yes gene_type:complete